VLLTKSIEHEYWVQIVNGTIRTKVQKPASVGTQTWVARAEDPNEEARDYTRALMETEAYAVSSGERKKIERLFGEAKHILSMVRLRLRGLTGARDEFLLTATVQNLKRLANHTTRPPPQPMMA
jgi:hypothetical protein